LPAKFCRWQNSYWRSLRDKPVMKLAMKKHRIWAENLCIHWPAVLKQQNESA
jgi:hypothetical protein